MVDVKKSRIECEEFVAAEASRHAFTASNMWAAQSSSFIRNWGDGGFFTLALLSYLQLLYFASYTTTNMAVAAATAKRQPRCRLQQRLITTTQRDKFIQWNQRGGPERAARSKGNPRRNGRTGDWTQDLHNNQYEESGNTWSPHRLQMLREHWSNSEHGDFLSRQPPAQALAGTVVQFFSLLRHSKMGEKSLHTPSTTHVCQSEVRPVVALLEENLFIRASELRDRVMVAVKDANGRISWVTLVPAYHSILVQTSITAVKANGSKHSSASVVQHKVQHCRSSLTLYKAWVVIELVEWSIAN